MTPWQTAKECAFRLGVGDWCIRYWARRGLIRKRRVKCGWVRIEYKVDLRPRILPPRCKFTKSQARAVLRYRGLASAAVIGVIFGMSGSTVQGIWRGEKHQRL